jgi:hypothetical protein
MARHEHLDDQPGPATWQRRGRAQYSHRENVDNANDRRRRSLPHKDRQAAPQVPGSCRVLAVTPGKVRGALPGQRPSVRRAVLALGRGRYLAGSGLGPSPVHSRPAVSPDPRGSGSWWTVRQARTQASLRVGYRLVGRHPTNLGGGVRICTNNRVTRRAQRAMLIGLGVYTPRIVCRRRPTALHLVAVCFAWVLGVARAGNLRGEDGASLPLRPWPAEILSYRCTPLIATSQGPELHSCLHDG